MAIAISPKLLTEIKPEPIKLTKEYVSEFWITKEMLKDDIYPGKIWSVTNMYSIPIYGKGNSKYINIEVAN